MASMVTTNNADMVAAHILVKTGVQDTSLTAPNKPMAGDTRGCRKVHADTLGEVYTYKVVAWQLAVSRRHEESIPLSASMQQVEMAVKDKGKIENYTKWPPAQPYTCGNRRASPLVVGTGHSKPYLLVYPIDVG
jgi:hypothetical protein